MCGAFKKEIINDIIQRMRHFKEMLQRRKDERNNIYTVALMVYKNIFDTFQDVITLAETRKL